jgi:hypothetical protein
MAVTVLCIHDAEITKAPPQPLRMTNKSVRPLALKQASLKNEVMEQH